MSGSHCGGESSQPWKQSREQPSSEEKQPASGEEEQPPFGRAAGLGASAEPPHLLPAVTAFRSAAPQVFSLSP